MALISLHSISLTFGGSSLFDAVSLHIEEGDRFCLLGRNGAGKSTLLKMIEGIQMPDSGAIARDKGLKVAYVSQEIPPNLVGSIGEVIGEGDADRAHERSGILGQLALNEGEDFALASGGTKRRALLARALISYPHILLLDEPTNHLDIETIEWLESHIETHIKTLVFVTHDKAFAKRIANRVAELDRGKLYTFNASLEEFIARREQVLDAEEKASKLFDKRLEIEEAWIRRGVKARRTRDEGRVKALVAMRQAYKERRTRQGGVKLEIGDAQKSGDLVAKIDSLSFSYPEKSIVKDYSTLITRGDRIGIVGRNGLGKTTLIKLLLSELNPQGGTVKLGTKLETIYFDQLRQKLEESKSLAYNICGDDDVVMVGGRQRHINAYLQDFLFSPDRARNPVSILSGGERNRLLLAKLFSRPSNLLIMDEPTNDLDAETMDLLIDLLVDYQGTLIVVSHDRHFLDNVVTNLIVLEGEGRATDFVGTWSEWKTYQGQKKPEAKKQKPSEAPKSEPQTPAKPKKLSFKEKHELEALPDLIAGLEAELETIHAELANPDLYKQGNDAVQARVKKQATLEADLAKAYARWEELEGK